MHISLRSIIGLATAFATMAVVLASAILAPGEPSSAMASTCPSKTSHGVQTLEPSGA